jgi:hypothetical protein
MKRRKRRAALPPIAAVSRIQQDPGAMVAALDRTLRQNIEALAATGYERHGRGVLNVVLDATIPSGIKDISYSKLADLDETQPLTEAAQTYDPAKEFVALVLNVTRTLPGPQLWFDIFPKLKE